MLTSITQPAILIVRFLFNLRQFNTSKASSASRGPQNFSQFSIPGFNVPSGFLGNIGEPLDHSQSGRYIHEDDEESVVPVELVGLVVEVEDVDSVVLVELVVDDVVDDVVGVDDVDSVDPDELVVDVVDSLELVDGVDDVEEVESVVPDVEEDTVIVFVIVVEASVLVTSELCTSVAE